jgi:hypothetical protein
MRISLLLKVVAVEAVAGGFCSSLIFRQITSVINPPLPCPNHPGDCCITNSWGGVDKLGLVKFTIIAKVNSNRGKYHHE